MQGEVGRSVGRSAQPPDGDGRQATDLNDIDEDEGVGDSPAAATASYFAPAPDAALTSLPEPPRLLMALGAGLLLWNLKPVLLLFGQTETNVNAAGQFLIALPFALPVLDRLGAVIDLPRRVVHFLNIGRYDIPLHQLDKGHLGFAPSRTNLLRLRALWAPPQAPLGAGVDTRRRHGRNSRSGRTEWAAPGGVWFSATSSTPVR